jgi:hypothetical protein
VTATSQTARPIKPEPKSTAATKPAAGKSKKKAAASVKTAVTKPKTPDLVVPTQSSTSQLEAISDLLDSLTLQACVELTCRLLTPISLTAWAASPRAALKTVILFVVEYGSTPKEHARVISILKPGKDPALPSSY